MTEKLRAMQRTRRRLLDGKLREARAHACDALLFAEQGATECLDACIDCIEARKRDKALGWLDSQFHADGFEPTNRI